MERKTVDRPLCTTPKGPPFLPAANAQGLKGDFGYGLNVKKSKPTALGGRLAVFGKAEEDEPSKESVLKQQEARARAREKKVAKTYEEALAHDATVFDYDGVYETMKSEKEKKLAEEQARKAQRKPKYIKAILRQAEFRKIENDIIYSRTQLKERVKDDKEFEGKSKFMTEAYKKRLKADKAWLLKQNKIDAEEAAKKVDMTSFYRNVLDSADQLDVQASADSDSDEKVIERARAQEELRRERVKRTRQRAFERARVSEQKATLEAKAKERAAERKRARERAFARRNDEKAVLSAKERFLARKRARQAAAAAPTVAPEPAITGADVYL